MSKVTSLLKSPTPMAITEVPYVHGPSPQPAACSLSITEGSDQAQDRNLLCPTIVVTTSFSCETSCGQSYKRYMVNLN